VVGHTLTYRPFIVPIGNCDVRMWVHVGPGDDGEPVATIMLEGED
jgi:hypothetical protein